MDRDKSLNARKCDIVTMSFSELSENTFSMIGSNGLEAALVDHGITILKNTLLESNSPEGEVLGRNITFQFKNPIEHTTSIDLYGVQGSDSFIEVDSGDSEDPIKVDFTGSGPNLAQRITLPFNNVRRVTVFLSGTSSFVTEFKFCVSAILESAQTSDMTFPFQAKLDNNLCTVLSSPCPSEATKVQVCKYEEGNTWREVCLEESQWSDAKKVWTVYCGTCEQSRVEPQLYRPKTASVVTESLGTCNVGNYGASNIEILSSDGDVVLFSLKHSFDFDVERAQIWFRDSNHDDEFLCFDENNIARDEMMGRFQARCDAGWAKVHIVAEKEDIFKQTQTDFDVMKPTCQKGFDFIEFNPMKRCYWTLNVPCTLKRPSRHLSIESLQKINILRSSVHEDCVEKSKDIDVVSVAVDACRQAVDVSPIKILSQNKDTVTFTVSQQWKGCGREDFRTLTSLAVDYIDIDDHLQCSKLEHVSCGVASTFTSICSHGASVVDLYTYDANSELFQRLDGLPLAVPFSCNLSGDARRMCHFRFILKCQPSLCQLPENGKRLGSKVVL